MQVCLHYARSHNPYNPTTIKINKDMEKNAGTQPENNEIRIYQSPYKSLSLAGLCLLFAAGGVFILNDDDCSMAVKLVGGWLNIAFFGLGGLKKSYHTINLKDVKRFRIISTYGSKLIAVNYKQEAMDRLFGGSNGITTQLMAYNLKKAGAAISIPTANLTMKAKDICAILNKRINGTYQQES